jgi:nicotinate-nucleotide adenylyltransferase
MTGLINILLPPGKINLKIGLFFGSFNPVHIGHMAIANYLVEFTGINQLWFVVSPQNPFKKTENLLADHHRLELMLRAVNDDPRFRVSDVEFHLPKPSYTIDTLNALKEKFPTHQFVPILGSDNLEGLPQWKSYETILESYEIMVYPRPGFDPSKFILHRNILKVDAPLLEISSTFIRDSIRDRKNMRFFLPQKVWEYIQEMQFYKKP